MTMPRQSPVRSRLFPASIFIFAVLALLFAFRPSAYATGYIVSKTADTNDGTCNADCSLREAITAANSTPANDTITFAAGANGTITVASELPAVANNGTLQITGNGKANTVISGNDTVRVLNVAAGAGATIRNLTLRDGRVMNPISLGGGILNNGTLTIENSSITSNSAPNGAGIYNASGSSLTVTDSSFSENAAIAGGGIGATFNTTVTVTNSTFEDNTTSGNSGAAIQAAGTFM